MMDLLSLRINSDNSLNSNSPLPLADMLTSPSPIQQGVGSNPAQIANYFSLMGSGYCSP